MNFEHTIDGIPDRNSLSGQYTSKIHLTDDGSGLLTVDVSDLLDPDGQFALEIDLPAPKVRDLRDALDDWLRQQ